MLHDIWECWIYLAYGFWDLAKLTAPFLAGYGVLYAVTAALFLLTLRVKSEDGKLSVRKDSLAFFLAHPMSKYYGLRSTVWSSAADMHVPRYGDKGSICAFYARLFNMLLFVWPFLLLYLIVVTVGLFVIGSVFLGKIWVPDFAEEMFFRERLLFGKTQFPLMIVILPVVLIVMAVVKFAALVKALSWIAMTLACLIPAIIVVGLIVLVSSRIYKGRGETASAAKEFIVGKKERFCKILEFK